MSGVYHEDNGESVIVRCECHTEAIEASLDKVEPDCVYIAAWSHGHHDDIGKRLPLWRIQVGAIWRIITKGTTWSDDIVLNADKARALGLKLIEFANDIDRFQAARVTKIDENAREFK
jgi:hypothetical protein